MLPRERNFGCRTHSFASFSAGAVRERRVGSAVCAARHTTTCVRRFTDGRRSRRTTGTETCGV
eukprot:scaffold16880_cov126-Isochrysis_galbana.AAC.5